MNPSNDQLIIGTIVMKALMAYTKIFLKNFLKGARLIEKKNGGTQSQRFTSLKRKGGGLKYSQTGYNRGLVNVMGIFTKLG